MNLPSLVLEAAQGRAQVVLVDRCTIWRDPEGSRDDEIDPDTLSYLPLGDAEAAAVDVPCKADHQQRNSFEGEAGQPTIGSEYVIAFAAGTDVRAGDRVEMTATANDLALFGLTFTVVEPLHGTFTVLQRVRATLRQQGVERP